MLPHEIRKRDRDVLEASVPAHMLFLTLEQAGHKGIEVRPDVLDRLNTAAAKRFATLDLLSVSRLAKQVDDMARSLLREVFLSEDPAEAVCMAAMFTLVLVDEGLHPDPQDMSVLVSLLIIDDAKAEGKDTVGNEAVVHVKEAKWREKAHALLTRARLQQAYHRKPVQLDLPLAMQTK